VDRQIGVSGKFWNFNRGHTSVAETTTFFKCTVFGFHVLHKSEVTEAAESEVTEPDEFHVVSDEIRRWSSHESFRRRMSAPFVSAEDGILNEFEMMWQLRILFPLHFVVFKQTVCHLTAETNVEQVFSRAGQFSEVNLDRGFLTDMVSIMVNKLAYKPSVKDIMDKYYEMFRGKNSGNKKDFFNSPDSPEDSDVSEVWKNKLYSRFTQVS